MKKLRAFTLIELLIVVAIIAILAAIAVPNFLEAQVRAKVSRTRADMQAVGTAVETYRVDRNAYPWHPEEGNIFYWYQMDLAITTPVAYLTSREAMRDVFLEGWDENTLPSDTAIGRQFDIEFKWVNWETRDQLMAPTFRNGDPRFSNRQWYGTAGVSKVSIHGPWELASVGPGVDWRASVQPFSRFGHFFLPYDPTNGTISQGAIVRAGGDPEGRLSVDYTVGGESFAFPSFPP